MLLNILLVILVIDCIALTAVILMQRSEGGALGMGGGPAGMFTARGAGDLLTRMTSIFTTVFFVLSLGITLLAGHTRENGSLTQKLKVNPIDVSALASGSSAPAPAASAAPAAPPLPGSAPPLPGSAPPLPGATLPGFNNTAPPHAAAAAVQPKLRQQLPATAPTPAAPAGALRTQAPVLAKPAPLIIPKPAPLAVPPPAATTPPPAATTPAAPAGQAPSGQ
jgi:preprotein translocase subunit SecG